MAKPTTSAQGTAHRMRAFQTALDISRSRFIELLWNKVGLVVVADDKTAAGYGIYYTKKNPLPALTGADL